MVALDAVAALQSLVVDLGGGVALRADAADQVVAGQAAAGSDGWVPHLVGLASDPADPVGGVVGLGGRANSAAVADEVVAGLADAVAVDVLLVGVAAGDAEAEVEDVSLVADAGLGGWVVGRVKWAGSAGAIGHLVVLRQADAGLRADVEDSLGVAGDSADAEALVIDLVPLALPADAVDWIVSGDAAALSVGEDLVGSASDHAEAALVPVAVRASTGLFLGVVGGVARALLAGSINHVEGSSAAAGAADAVVDLVGLAGNPADLKGDVEESTRCANLADSVDQVVAQDADADLVDEDLVGSALAGGDGKWPGWDWGAGGGNAVSVVKSVALDAVTALALGVVGGVGLASSALSVDVEEARQADAGQGVDVQNLVGGASGPADGGLSVVVVGGHAVGADSLDEVEVGEALADVVDQLLVDRAGGWRWHWSWGWRSVRKCAGSIDKSVARDAGARERGELIGGVRRADVAS